FPTMAEKELEKIASQAEKRWPIQGLTIIHRYGKLLPGDQIVLVITTSHHREAAFNAAQFIMDWLKTDAPFWKKEETSDGTHWVASKSDDDEKKNRWN
ncbi:MAG: molybdenum cofactor biosynthesis protein MoaE, partial [Emcibacteraceae bacterium]|nr:molybdenum cofactor biosynthesis protein MoaE [Emcibacteraceae bacterium]